MKIILSTYLEYSVNYLKLSIRLDDEDSGDALKLVSGAHGMRVPSACTIVIIAGHLHTETGRGF